MTERELAEIRNYLQIPPLQGTGVLVKHCRALLAAVDERDGIIADLMQDNGYLAEGERASLIDEFARLAQYCRKQSVQSRQPWTEPNAERASVYELACALIRDRGKAAQAPLPPDQARARANRYHEALEEILAIEERRTAEGGFLPLWAQIARKALLEM